MVFERQRDIWVDRESEERRREKQRKTETDGEKEDREID